MEDRIVRFVSALRAGGIRVSLAETADAFNAVDQMGIKDRDTFRLSLRSTLVKESADIPVFEELFPLFFDSPQLPPLMDLSQDLTPDEARMLAEALQQFNQYLREMLKRLMQGKQLSQEELEQLAQMVGLDRADDLRYREWMAQRMEQALKFPEVRKALGELAELLEQMGMNKERLRQLQGLLQANQNALEEQLDQYAGQRIAENMSSQRPDQGLDSLLNRPFEKLRKEIKRLAATLRTRVALRQKRAKSGQLDAKATIRANLKHGNVPIEIKHRNRTLKPKVVAICDISTSMRPCSELMLSLLYAMQDQISKTYAFAFIDHLEFVSPDFVGKEAQEAVATVLNQMPPGHYNTDLGISLKDFSQDYMDTVDSRTTFLVVGDGRNNYNRPRLDIFKRISRRCRQLIWLNPEPTTFWGQGDSDMLRYAPFCDEILQVGNLSELTRAVDHLLTH